MLVEVNIPEGKHCNLYDPETNSYPAECPFFNGEWNTCQLLNEKPEWDCEEAEHLKLPGCPGLKEEDHGSTEHTEG